MQHMWDKLGFHKKNSVGKRNLGDLGLDVRILLNWIFTK